MSSDTFRQEPIAVPSVDKPAHRPIPCGCKVDGDWHAPCLIVGPVIGEYSFAESDNTFDVRVSYELCREAHVKLEVLDQKRLDENDHQRRPLDHAAYGRTLLDTSTNAPFTFELWGLTPGEVYRCRLAVADPACDNGSSIGLEASEVELRVPPTNPSEVRLYAVSCNRRDVDETRSSTNQAWSELRGSLERQENNRTWTSSLHLGDQVYCDAVFEGAVRTLQDLDRPDRFDAWNEARDVVYQDYADVYRETWKRTSTGAADSDLTPIAKVLRTAPNLMIWDDHDITDDWGMLESQGRAESIENQVGRIANRAYLDYQGALKDPLSVQGRYHEGSVHRFGKQVAVVMLDPRSGRSFDRSNASPVLGDDQWDRLLRVLDEPNLRALVICSPVPLVLLGTRLTRRLGIFRRTIDIGDQWTTPAHRDELHRLLVALGQWQGDDASKREVVVVSGDAHLSAKMLIHPPAIDGVPKSAWSRPITHLVTSPVAGGTAGRTLGSLLHRLASTGDIELSNRRPEVIRAAIDRIRRPSGAFPTFRYEALQWDYCSYADVSFRFDDAEVAEDAAGGLLTTAKIVMSNGPGEATDIMAIDRLGRPPRLPRWLGASAWEQRSRIGSVFSKPAKAVAGLFGQRSERGRLENVSETGLG